MCEFVANFPKILQMNTFEPYDPPKKFLKGVQPSTIKVAKGNENIPWVKYIHYDQEYPNCSMYKCVKKDEPFLAKLNKNKDKKK
jgi:hypothetical protein